MSDIVDLVIEDPRWEDTPLAELAETAAELALRHAGIDTRDVEIALLACDDARIATLNSEFRGMSAATNVLSWPALDLFPDLAGEPPGREIPTDPHGPLGLGDIAIAYETVRAEARSGGIPLDDHILHLILHACLHLLGYDHQDDADAAIMEGIEVKALASQGIASPY